MIGLYVSSAELLLSLLSAGGGHLFILEICLLVLGSYGVEGELPWCLFLTTKRVNLVYFLIVFLVAPCHYWYASFHCVDSVRL